MSSLVKAVLDQQIGPIDLSKEFTQQLKLFQIGFVNKNKAHTEFFGGNLTGVQIVRFTESEKLKWFEEILKTSENLLTEPLHRIPALQNENGVFLVSGDPMNLSVIWLVHQLMNSKLPQKVKHDAMIDALLILQFKFLTSRLFVHFKYPADAAVANAVYARLSNKFSIKIYGTWLGVLRHRAEDIISPTSIHYKTLLHMDRDEGVVRCLNDIQGRIREMLKNIYNVHLQVLHEGSKIQSTSSVVEHDGVQILKDQSRGLQNYTRYLLSIVSDKNSLIKDELLTIIHSIVPSSTVKNLTTVLEYISVNHLANKKVDDLLDQIMIHSFSYLSSNRLALRSNISLSDLLARLKGVYTSSRSTDPDLLTLRKLAEEIVQQAVKIKTKSVIASIRTSLLLYLIARTYTMQHYTTN